MKSILAFLWGGATVALWLLSFSAIIYLLVPAILSSCMALAKTVEWLVENWKDF